MVNALNPNFGVLQPPNSCQNWLMPFERDATEVGPICIQLQTSAVSNPVITSLKFYQKSIGITVKYGKIVLATKNWSLLRFMIAFTTFSFTPSALQLRPGQEMVQHLGLLNDGISQTWHLLLPFFNRARPITWQVGMPSAGHFPIIHLRFSSQVQRLPQTMTKPISK